MHTSDARTNHYAPPAFYAAPWYCLRAQPRREIIAVQTLRTLDGVEAFCPRVRYTLRTRGMRQSEVSLFPGYLFARFAPDLSKQITYSNGVARIVRRGTDFVEVPSVVIRELLALAPYPECLLRLADPVFFPGQTVRIIGGVFKRTEAKIARLLPAKQRVAVLINLLGKEDNEVLLPLTQIDELDPDPRRRIPQIAGVRRASKKTD
ncbi:MAG: hypothetical protein LBT53_10320 [Puniceicoccales bacterium]|jgi:transcriptional antiterminator RfaH|nr:hypothetical protein [Puniceicoccales bacterium]